MYNGKYGGCVLKVQAICNHTGAFIWYSGPHLGTTHDVKLYRRVHPPMNGQKVLADLAYIGGQERAHELIVPFKKQLVRRRVLSTGRVSINSIPLTENQSLFNRIHAWYRTTIEHAFGFVKRFRIINSTYRGRIKQHPDYVTRAVKIIMSVSNIHLRAHPHRQHIAMIDGDIDLQNIDFDGLISRPWDDNNGTGHCVDDFWNGQHVQLHLPTGEWINGIVRYRNRRCNKISIMIRGAARGDLVRVDPRLVRHAPP
jgi:hypothetical protein